MADHTSITDTTSQPIQETSSEAIAGQSLDHPPENPSEQPPEPSPPIEPMRLNREQRREVNISHITETILETFEAHDGRMRARSHKPPKLARRICQIILHGPHSDVGAMVAVDEPYTVIVTCNRIPVKAEEWRAATMATLSERLGMPVHITLMKEERFLAHCRNVTPFYEALSISHDTLYPYDGGAYLPLGPEAEIPAEAKVITPDKRSDERPDERPDETPVENPDDSAEDTPAETPEPEESYNNWWNAPDMLGYKQAYDREQGTLSFDDVMLDMEEPIVRLNDAAVLLTDLAYGGMHDVPPRARGLDFIAQALTRDARLLYRLYYGSTPNYC